jgi:glutamyl-tRNA reductase
MRHAPHSVEHFVSFQLPLNFAGQLPPENFVILTCQRLECYAFSESASDLPEVAFDIHRGWATLERLAYLCVGGDSQLLGETEIFGQVKDFYREQHARLSKPLHWLIQSAFWIAKGLRTHQPIHSGPMSYGGWIRRALFSHNTFPKSDSPILFLGAGKLIQEVAHFIGPRLEPARMYWCNRTEARAHELAKRYGGRVIAFSPDALKHFPFQVVAIREPSSLLEWQSAWMGWGALYKNDGMVIDFSSPLLVPSELVAKSLPVLTLSDLQKHSTLELKHRQQKQLCLREDIREWVAARWSREDVQSYAL